MRMFCVAQCVDCEGVWHGEWSPTVGYMGEGVGIVSNSDGCVSRLNLGRHHTEVGIDGEATTRGRRRYGV